MTLKFEFKKKQQSNSKIFLLAFECKNIPQLAGFPACPDIHGKCSGAKTMSAWVLPGLSNTLSYWGTSDFKWRRKITEFFFFLIARTYTKTVYLVKSTVQHGSSQIKIQSGPSVITP